MTSLRAFPLSVNSERAGAEKPQLRFRPITEARQNPARSYLLPGRLAYGCLSLIIGHGGVMKSHMLACLAAGVLGGLRLPGMHRKRDVGNVLIVSREQDQHADLRPQIQAAGGDPARVFSVDDDDDATGQAWNWWTFLEVLEGLIEQHRIALVGLDPIFNVLPPGMNNADPQAMRHVLQPLHRIAMRTGVAVVCTHHRPNRVNKGAHWQGLSSVELFNVARCVLLLAAVNDRDGWYAMRAEKHQFGPRAPDLLYRHAGEGGPDAIVFGKEEALEADALDAGEQDAGEQLHNDMATDILRALWQDEPLSWTVLTKRADKDRVNMLTLRRRMRKLGITTDAKGRWNKDKTLVFFPPGGPPAR
jgi:hypothetical protein